MGKGKGEGVKSRWEETRKGGALATGSTRFSPGNSSQGEQRADENENHAQQSRALGQLGAECELQ